MPIVIRSIFAIFVEEKILAQRPVKKPIEKALKAMR